MLFLGEGFGALGETTGGGGGRPRGRWNTSVGTAEAKEMRRRIGKRYMLMASLILHGKCAGELRVGNRDGSRF